MAKQATKIQRGGRISIDADIRRELGLEEGDYVVINVEPLEADNEE